MTIKGIDVTLKQVNDFAVNFIRVGDTYGWFFEVNGERYGDWFIDTDNSVENYNVMEQQALATMNELKI